MPVSTIWQWWVRRSSNAVVILGSPNTAAIDWCKLFGSDDAEHQQLHWKNVLPKAEHDAFRKTLYQILNTDQAGFDAYWREMTNYRNEHAAHRDFIKNNVTHFPRLDKAILSCHVYYKSVIEKLRTQGETRYPDKLEVYGISFEEQAKKIARIAIDATKSIEECVR